MALAPLSILSNVLDRNFCAQSVTSVFLCSFSSVTLSIILYNSLLLNTCRTIMAFFTDRIKGPMTRSRSKLIPFSSYQSNFDLWSIASTLRVRF